MTTSQKSLQCIGVGIDTARYGHHVSFLREDKQPAAEPMTICESRKGYEELQARLVMLQQHHPRVQFQIHVDAAGQYADNLISFLRSVPFPISLSVGEPKRNKDYHRAMSPKRKADATESFAMARFAVVERPAETPKVPVPFLTLRRVAGRLASQSKQTSRTINQLHNLLSAVFPELATLVDDISCQWLLKLLKQYPTPARIAGSRPGSLAKIPYLKADLAESILAAAKTSVGVMTGEATEDLVRHLVDQLELSLRAENNLKQLLQKAYETLPSSNHENVETIIGIGKTTAAALVATIVTIDRFASPDALVGYYGVFPEEDSSGVDKYGKPNPPGKMRMSRKGNDLVRGLLWNCTKSAMRHNPAVRALYNRLIGKGVRGDVAMGYCMKKLLHLVFAVWKTGKPFDPQHYPWEPSRDEAQGNAEKEKVAGRKGQSPTDQPVTATIDKLEPISDRVNQVKPTNYVNFANIRQQITMEQVLRELGWLEYLHPAGTHGQLRGSCPVHAERPEGRSFSVNLSRHIFQCFDRQCGAQGNVLDLWALVKKLSLHDAALELAAIFNLNTHRTEKRNPLPPSARSPEKIDHRIPKKTGGITPAPH